MALPVVEELKRKDEICFLRGRGLEEEQLAEGI